MTFVRANPAGWALFELLTSAQMNVIDSQMPYALDGQSGGSYAPTDAIILDGTPNPSNDYMLELLGRATGKGLYVEGNLTGDVDGCAHAVAWNPQTYAVYAQQGADGAGVAPVGGIASQGGASTAGDAGRGIITVGGLTTFATGTGGAGIEALGGNATGTGLNFGGAGVVAVGGDSDETTAGSVGGAGMSGEGGESYIGGAGVFGQGGISHSPNVFDRGNGVHGIGGQRDVSDSSAGGWGVYGVGADGVNTSGQPGSVGVSGLGGDADTAANTFGGSGGYFEGGAGGDGGTGGDGGDGIIVQGGTAGATGTNDGAAVAINNEGNGPHIKFPAANVGDTPPTTGDERGALRAQGDGQLYYRARVEYPGVTAKWAPLVPICMFQGYVSGGNGGGSSSMSFTANKSYNVDDIDNPVGGASFLVTFEDTMPAPIGADYIVEIKWCQGGANGGSSSAQRFDVYVESKTSTGFLLVLWNLSTGALESITASNDDFGLDIMVYAPPQPAL